MTYQVSYMSRKPEMDHNFNHPYDEYSYMDALDSYLTVGLMEFKASKRKK